MKRTLDVTLSLLGLIVLSPILCILMLLIRICLGAPIFFTQTRPGLNEKTFKLIKFRTMKDVKDSNGLLLPDDMRLTKLGLFLRATSLDELPELWNVIKGEMSLVGPRPLLEEYLSLYSAEQKRRHEVRPGITGWAQINGRNAISWEQKFEHDLWYVQNQTLVLDLKILYLTIKKVFKREGIQADGSATTEKFQGSNQGVDTCQY